MMQLDPSTSSISTPTNPIPSERPLQVEVITYMDSDLFQAAQDGDTELFNKCEGDLRCLVDGGKNTALHIYSRNEGRQVVKNDKRFLCFRKWRSEREFSKNFVEQLVDKCPSLLLQPNAKGEIPLHIAARHGNSDLLKYLIESAKLVQQEDPEKGLKQMLRMKDKDNNTAMHKAVESGDLDVVRLLVKDLDPDFSFSANISGETPLYIAAKAGRNKLVAEILNNCKSMDYGGSDGRTALHAAVMARDKESVRKLIVANKQLTKETDNNGWTPLHYAAYYSSRSIARLLLESDASAAYIADKERGMTALHLAGWGNNEHIVEDIISHCPGCCEIADKRGWNFLHFIVITFEGMKLKRFLLDDKNKIKDLPIRNLVDKKDVNGNTPLDILGYRQYSADGWFSSSRVFKFLTRQSSENSHYIYSRYKTKKKQIQKLLKDMANDEEGIGLPIQIFRAIVKKVEETEGITRSEIEEKARDSHLVVATLVTTVTFAAAFAVPGGYKSDQQGTATLIRHSAFKTFVITNTLAFVSSLSAVCAHFSLMIFRGRVKSVLGHDFFQKADQLTVFAIAMMVIAFSTGTYAALESSLAFAITILCSAFVFFPAANVWYMIAAKLM